MGLLVLALGVALAVYVVRGKAVSRIFGMGVSALICIAFGGHMLFAKTQLDETGIVVRGFMGVKESATWGELAAVYIEDRASSKGGPSPYLILARKSGPEVEVRISALAPESRVRLLEFARAKVSR